jgi:N-acetyl sugar amidotransferase
VIELTAFGAWFVPALLSLSVLRRGWLPAAIPVAAVLQAPAPLVVALGEARFGITPFNLVMVAMSVAFLLDHGRDPRASWERLRAHIAWPWVVYLAYAAAAAVVLPFLFPDVLVHPMLARGDVQLAGVANRFSLSHVAQAINHLGLLLMLASVLTSRSPRVVLRAMGVGLALAFVISLTAAGYQRSVFLGWQETDFAWWASNPGYNQLFHAPEYGPVFGRVGLPFIEPSYASVWFAGAVGGAWLLALYWNHRLAMLAFLATALAGLGLLNTVGTSGLVAVAIFVPVLVTWHLLSPAPRTRRSNRMVVAMVLVLVAFASLALIDYVWWKSAAGQPLRSAIWFTMQKMSNLDDRPRFVTTLHALWVFVESGGLGIGPGSTRTSGFLVSLLAHLGLPGLALIAWAFWRTLRSLTPAGSDPWRLAAIGMLLAGGLGVLVGIADLAWPVAWTWILFAVAAMASPGGGVTAGDHDILEGHASHPPAGSQPDPPPSMNPASAREYRVCVRCVMDTSDSAITFDEHGVCDHCRTYERQVAPNWDTGAKGRTQLEVMAAEIIRAGQGKDFDCIIGMSGGIDSSYLTYVASKQLGLRPLVFHVDAGWNSQVAVNNIERVVDRLGLDLYTEVIDWEEMRDLQLAFFKSGVPHVDTPQDHAFFATMYKFAEQYDVRYILTGANLSTECIRNPLEWMYYQSDSVQLRDIHRRFGTRPLQRFPITTILHHKVYLPYVKRIRTLRPLNCVPYVKQEAVDLLMREFGWQPYPQKHFESRFTRFYEGYWLPARFGYDTRRVQYSSLIVTGQMSRDEALQKLESPALDAETVKNEYEYVATKLGITVEELRSYETAPLKTYRDYRNMDWVYRLGAGAMRLLGLELGGKR